MSPERRKQLFLAGLVLVLLAVGGRGLRELVFGAAGGPAAAATDSAAGDQDRASITEVVDLRLEKLEVEAEHYRLGRDPFRFGELPRPAPPPPMPTVEDDPVLPAPAASLPAPAGSQPPAVDVVYLGSFGLRHRPLAVFSDGSDIYNAFQGDVLKEKFIVEQVGYESVDLGFVGFPDAPSQRLAAGG